MPDIGTVSSSGSQSVQPTQTTTYTMIASGPGGQASQSVTITVAQPVPPTVTITADPSTIVAGQLSTITWSSTNATSITITPSVLGEDQTTLPLLGSAVVLPTATTTYVATATGVGGATATASTTVMLSGMQLNFSVNPSTIAPGQSATLSWSTVGVETLVIDNGVGDVSNQLPNGSVTVTPSVDTTYTATATGPGGTVTQAVAVTVGSAASNGSPIKHIIFMLQENRSFDSYFGQLGPYRASRLQQMGISASPSDVDGIPANVVLTNHHTGAQVSPFHYRTVCTENLSPSWNESHHDVALKGGDSAWPKTTTFTASSFGMKNFLDTTGSVPQKYDPNGTRAMGYYDQTDLPYYYELATQFATSDRWYSPLLANTIPNRMYLFTGTSFGHVRPDDNLKPAGGWTQPTIFRMLNQAGVSWRYYYQDSSVFLADFSDWNDPTISGKTYKISNWFSLLSQPNADSLLPQVVFIERAGQTGLDEHPLNNVQTGAADVQNIIAALMNSPAWASSVFIWSFDEAGGLYDHVPPFQEVLPDNIAPILRPGDIQATFNLSGMRVPLIVTSPYAKPHLVSHINRDYTSILKFIEKTFNVPSLTARDAAADDMSEFFDFTHAALLNAPTGQLWASYLPQQPTNGVCDQTLESGP
ncbi:MAG TPA: alkaline phosphatase family protein [Terriglobales bacterium]|nr:alkaline phosphatase family protein [Terriglobales bacterium]